MFVETMCLQIFMLMLMVVVMMMRLGGRELSLLKVIGNIVEIMEWLLIIRRWTVTRMEFKVTALERLYIIYAFSSPTV